MKTLLLKDCNTPTFLTCGALNKKRVRHTVITSSAALPHHATVAVKAGVVTVFLSAPNTPIPGESIVILYKGGAVTLVDGNTPSTTIYAFSESSDMNQNALFVFDGLNWTKQ